MKNVLQIKETRNDLILSLLLTGVVSYYLHTYQKSAIICSNYAAFVSLSATFLGFLITAYAILITFPESGKIRLLKEHKLYPSLFDAFLYGINVLIMYFVASLIGFILGISSFIFCIVTSFLLIYSVVWVLRIVWILRKMTQVYFSSL